MLSISTSWNDNLKLSWSDWFDHIKSLGFEAIELSYTVNRAQLAEIKALLPKKNFKVSSIHNFCPTPDDEPSSRHVSNYYRLSSLDRHERNKAIEWTNKCIDTAQEVGAQVVVIHAGTLELTDDPSKQLIALFKEGKKDSSEFARTREQVISVRKEKCGEFVKALEESLKAVAVYAQSKGIKIGLETRYYPIEMPNFAEVDYFLKLFSKYGMYYWHDVGHAEINDRLALAKQSDFINTYRNQLVGVHVHGMKEARDHLVPFDGDFDLEKVLKMLPKNLIYVVESRYGSVDQMKVAISKLKSIIG